MNSYSGYFIVGPTAVGKSSVAHSIAMQRGDEILSADSMLVYKGMDIGTAKPSNGEREEVRYHGVDLARPDEKFSVWSYRQRIEDSLRSCKERGNDLIVAGGTGLYVKALTQGLDPLPSVDSDLRSELSLLLENDGLQALQQRLKIASPRLFETLPSLDNPRRVMRAIEWAAAGISEYPENWGSETGGVVVGLTMDRKTLHSRISQRVEMMYSSGLTDEAAALLSSVPDLSETARMAIGYSEVFDYIEGRCSMAEATERTTVRTRRLAKRQMTWFRHQADVVWIEVDGLSCEECAEAVLSEWKRHGATRII